MAGATRIVIDGVSYPVDDATAVDFEEQQTLTDAQKARARSNIGAASQDDMTSVQNAVGNVPSGSNLQDEVTDLKSAVTTIDGIIYSDYAFTTAPSWSSGGINTKTGGASSSMNAVKTGYINELNFARIMLANESYWFFVCAYNKTDNRYIGAWDGTTWNIPSSVTVHPYLTRDFDCANIPLNAKIRVCFYGSNDVSVVNYLHFLSPISDTVDGINTRLTAAESDIDSVKDAIAGIIAADVMPRDFINSVYSWWIYPVGIYTDRIRQCLYIGYVDNAGHQGIISKNIATGAINRHVFRQAAADDHNGVSVNILPDGRIMAICTGHAETNAHYCYISKNAEDISEWNDVIVIPLPEGYRYASYTQVLYINNAWYMFYRCKGASDGYDYWAYSVSADGATWGNDVVFVNGQDRKYYCRAAVYDSTTVKLFLQSNYSMGQTDIRMCYIDLANGVVYNADHTTVMGYTASLTPIVYTDYAIVINKGDYRLRLFDVMQGTDNSIVYARLNATGNGYVTMYAKYANGEYTTYQMPDQGGVFSSGYQNGVSFIGQDAFVMCRNLTTKWSVDIYDFADGAFTLRKNLDVTASGNIKMMRPVNVGGGYTLHNRGEYTDYNVYDCDIVVKDVGA